MKHYAFIFASLFSLSMLQAQGIALDSSFAQNGYLHTGLRSSGNDYSSIMDLTPDSNIVVLASNLVGLRFCTFSTSGDSVRGYHFPVNFNNYSSISAIKALDDGGFLITDREKFKALKRINADGSIDTTFGTDGGAFLFYSKIQDLLISQDKRILLAGENLNDYNGVLSGAYVIAYDMQGRLDSTFGDKGKFRFHHDYLEFFNRIMEQPDGKLLVAGCALSDTALGFNTLFRLLPNGSLDSTFGVNGLVREQINQFGENYGIAIQPDQKMLICGSDFGLKAAIVVRYLPNGARDASFGDNGVVVLPMIREANDVIVLPNGKVLVYGSVLDVDYHTALIQLLPNGTLDPYFGTAGVYYNDKPEFAPPLKMKLLDGNQLFTTGIRSVYFSNSVSNYLQLQAYTLDLTVGVLSPQEKPRFQVYPNPVSEHFEIGFELRNKMELRFDLYDLEGKLLQTVVSPTTFESGNHSLPINLSGGLAAGNYLLTVSSAEKPLVTVQLIKI